MEFLNVHILGKICWFKHYSQSKTHPRGMGCRFMFISVLLILKMNRIYGESLAIVLNFFCFFTYTIIKDMKTVRLIIQEEKSTLTLY